MSRTLSINCGSGESLNVSVRCGCKPKACQIRLMVMRLSPVALARPRVDQCVSPRGVLSNVRITTCSTCASLIGARRPRPWFVIQRFQTRLSKTERATCRPCSPSSATYGPTVLFSNPSAHAIPPALAAPESDWLRARCASDSQSLSLFLGKHHRLLRPPSTHLRSPKIIDAVRLTSFTYFWDRRLAARGETLSGGKIGYRHEFRPRRISSFLGVAAGRNSSQSPFCRTRQSCHGLLAHRHH